MGNLPHFTDILGFYGQKALTKILSALHNAANKNPYSETPP